MARWSVAALLLTVALASLACGGSAAPVGDSVVQPAAPIAPAPAATAPEPQSAPPGAGQPPTPQQIPARGAPAASGPKYGGSVSFFVRADPRGGFEPHLPGGRLEARATFSLAYETLGVFDTQDGVPCSTFLRPYLAESWNFTSPTSVDLKLRPGVRFQNRPPVNGREMVADDVVFSYKRMFGQGLQVTLNETILSIEAVDKYTVRIKTKTPAALMTQDLFGWREAVVMAREAGGAEGKYDTFGTAVGTGPFILVEYTPGVAHVAKRNPDYWVKGRPYLDEVRLPIMRDPATRIAALQVGKLDFMEEVETVDKERLEARGAAVRFIPCEASAPYTLHLRNDIPPFSDVRVRRAMSMAIDREGMLKGIFRGEGLLVGMAPQFVEGAMKPEDFPADTRRYLQYNPTQAKQLLAEAGYPKGLTLEVFGTLAHGPLYARQLEALPAMLRPSGFEATLKVGDLAAYNDVSRNLRYGTAGVLRNSTSFPLETLLLLFHGQQGAASNRSAVKDPEYDRLLDQMAATFDAKERLAIMRQLQILSVDRAYWISFPTAFGYTAVSNRLREVEHRVNAPMSTDGLHRGLVFVDAWVER